MDRQTLAWMRTKKLVWGDGMMDGGDAWIESPNGNLMVLADQFTEQANQRTHTQKELDE